MEYTHSDRKVGNKWNNNIQTNYYVLIKMWNIRLTSCFVSNRKPSLVLMIKPKICDYLRRYFSSQNPKHGLRNVLVILRFQMNRASIDFTFSFILTAHTHFSSSFNLFHSFRFEIFEYNSIEPHTKMHGNIMSMKEAWHFFLVTKHKVKSTNFHVEIHENYIANHSNPIQINVRKRWDLPWFQIKTIDE